MIERVYDVAIIGGGPAGIAAAVVCAEAGLSIALLDSAMATGGAYAKRAAKESGPRAAASGTLGQIAALEQRLNGQRITLLMQTTVWAIEPGRATDWRLRTRGAERDPVVGSLRARRVIIATGAHDRHLPVPGWTLPGVMSAGAAQSLIKSAGVLPGRRAVVAGTGPFLLAVAATLIEAGAEVAAVVEASDPRRSAAALVRQPGARDKLAQGAGYAALLARHRVPYLLRHRVIAVGGSTKVESVSIARVDRDWRTVPGTARTITCDVVATGYGFTAALDLPVQLGCATDRSSDCGLRVVVDDDGATSVNGVYAAGESTGVGGAELALAEGAIAGAAVVATFGRTVAPKLIADAKSRRRRAAGFADVVNASTVPGAGWVDALTEETTVCRCEEVSAGDLRAALRLGADDARTAKLLSRVGMGMCQGRMCGFAADLICGGQAAGGTLRPVAVPVRLGDIADLSPASNKSPIAPVDLPTSE